MAGDGLTGDANRLFFWFLSTDRSSFLFESSTVKSSENFLGIIFRPDLLTTKSLPGGTHATSSSFSSRFSSGSINSSGFTFILCKMLDKWLVNTAPSLVEKWQTEQLNNPLPPSSFVTSVPSTSSGTRDFLAKLLVSFFFLVSRFSSFDLFKPSSVELHLCELYTPGRRKPLPQAVQLKVNSLVWQTIIWSLRCPDLV